MVDRFGERHLGCMLGTPRKGGRPQLNLALDGNNDRTMDEWTPVAAGFGFIVLVLVAAVLFRHTWCSDRASVAGAARPHSIWTATTQPDV